MLSLVVVNVKEAVEEHIFGLTKNEDKLMKKQDKRNKIIPCEIANNLTKTRLEILTLGNLYLKSNNTRSLCLYQIATFLPTLIHFK